MMNILNNVLRLTEPVAGKILENAARNFISESNNDNEDNKLIELFVNDGVQLAGKMIATGVKKALDTKHEEEFIYESSVDIYELERNKEYKYYF